MSHRSKWYESIAKEADDLLREVLQVPETHEIFFFGGGGTAAFSAVPFNLLGDKTSANHLVTGSWSDGARAEAAKLCNVNLVGKPEKFNTIPDPESWNIEKDAAYFSYCDNETIYGVEFKDFPFDKIPEGMPLVADMSSNFLSKKIDVSKYGVIYVAA
jgi:phosphoserine aminotransferase